MCLMTFILSVATKLIMLSVVIPDVVILSVIILSVVILSVVILSVIILNVVILSVVMLGVFTPSVFILNVIVLSFVILNVAALKLLKIRTNRKEEQLAGSSPAPGLFCSEKEIQKRYRVLGHFINFPLCQLVLFVGEKN